VRARASIQSTKAGFEMKVSGSPGGVIRAVHLAGECPERAETRLPDRRHVDHERGLERDRLHVVQHVVRSPGLEGLCARGRLDAAKTRGEHRLGDEPGGGRMVGVAAVRRRHEENARPERAQHPRHLDAILERVPDVPVGQSQVHARVDAQDRRGFRGLALPDLGRAARSELAAGQVGNPHAVPLRDEQRDRASREELHVVGMGGERQDVERCVGHLSSPRS
jgi:hypothetical protein